jgi:hypothetical protein
MRVVGIALMVSVLCAACAIQPEGTDEGTFGSSATTAAATGVHLVVPGTMERAQIGAKTSDPIGAPTPCSGPDCDPQPQPWGGRPPSYVPRVKQ